MLLAIMRCHARASLAMVVNVATLHVRCGLLNAELLEEWKKGWATAARGSRRGFRVTIKHCLSPKLDLVLITL
jgi:hypothetical protein